MFEAAMGSSIDEAHHRIGGGLLKEIRESASSC